MDKKKEDGGEYLLPRRGAEIHEKNFTQMEGFVGEVSWGSERVKEGFSASERTNKGVLVADKEATRDQSK